MTLPGDYSPDDTPTASEINAIVDAILALQAQVASQSVLTAAQLADSTPVNNSTSYQSSTYLTVNLEATSTYTYKSLIIYDSNSTADFKHQLALPSGATVRRSTFTAVAAATATNTTIAMDALDTNAFNSGGITSGTYMCCFSMGLVATSGTAGPLTVQFSQATANASNTILKYGSWIELRKVA